MIAKTLDLIKRNPIVVIFYVGYLLVMFLIMLGIYPKDFDYTAGPAAMVAMAGKMLLATLVMGIIGLLFLSGYGAMLAEVLTTGQTSAGSFVPGLKKFFVRVLLASLLLLAFYIGFSIVLGIITIPFSVISALKGCDPMAVGAMMGRISSLVSMVIAVFVAPFIILWYPSIFIDGVGVIEGLKRGAKAGKKSYWTLVAVMAVMNLPMIMYMVSNFGSLAGGFKFTSGYVAVCLIMSLISVFILPMIFVIYNEKKEAVQ